MKNLFDLCTIAEGTRGRDAIRVTAKARIRDDDPVPRMEERLLLESEYALLRGRPGILREVNVTTAGRLDGQAVLDLYNAIPEKYRVNAVFLMNAVTLHELYLSLGHDNRGLLKCDCEDGFKFTDVPIVLIDSMPCADDGSVPILCGDLSQITVRDCGHDEMLRSAEECIMTGYLSFQIEDRDAVRGLKIINNLTYPANRVMYNVNRIRKEFSE